MPRARLEPHEKARRREIYMRDHDWAEIKSVAAAAGQTASVYFWALHARRGPPPTDPALVVARLQRLDRLHAALERIVRRIETEPASPDTARLLAELVCLERRLAEMGPGPEAAS